MKNDVLRIWILNAKKYIWLYDTNLKRLKKQLIFISFLNIIFIGFFYKSFFEFMCLFFLFIETQFFISIFQKNIVKHNVAKKNYYFFLEEIKQDLSLSCEDMNSFLLYKKLEFDKLIRTSPKLSESVFKKFKKKFNVLPFSKINKKYSLYQRIILIKNFNKWKNIKKRIFNPISLGPFYGNRRYFFEFQNIKIEKDNIEISIE